jgi:hypothetical protein
MGDHVNHPLVTFFGITITVVMAVVGVATIFFSFF